MISYVDEPNSRYLHKKKTQTLQIFWTCYSSFITCVQNFVVFSPYLIHCISHYSSDFLTSSVLPFGFLLQLCTVYATLKTANQALCLAEERLRTFQAKAQLDSPNNEQKLAIAKAECELAKTLPVVINAHQDLKQYRHSNQSLVVRAIYPRDVFQLRKMQEQIFKFDKKKTEKKCHYLDQDITLILVQKKKKTSHDQDCNQQKKISK